MTSQRDTNESSLRSSAVFFCGLAPSWILVDGIFAQTSIFDRTQPEGLALATYLGAVSATVNTVIVPSYQAAQGWLQWPRSRWLKAIAYAQIGGCALAASAWRVHVGGFSIVLYLVMAIASTAGNGQQLVLLPWIAGDVDNKWMAMAMAGGQAGALVAAVFALLQDAFGAIRDPTYCFAFIGILLAFSTFAIQKTIRATVHHPLPIPVSTNNPLQQGEDEFSELPPQVEAVEKAPVKSRWHCCWEPFVAFRGGMSSAEKAWRRDANAIAWSNAYLQLVSWVFVRSTLPYAFKAVRPRSAGKDGGAYLSLAVNLSLASCFIGAVLANRPKATVNVAVVNLVGTAAFLTIALCTLFARGPVDTPAYAILVLLAAVLIRGLDGYCSPLFYREPSSSLVVSPSRSLSLLFRPHTRTLERRRPRSTSWRFGYMCRHDWRLGDARRRHPVRVA